MIIDCHSCPVRELHCADCMVTALVTPSGSQLVLDAAEQAAVGRLVTAGLVSAPEGAAATARREPWEVHTRAVG